MLSHQITEAIKVVSKIGNELRADGIIPTDVEIIKYLHDLEDEEANARIDDKATEPRYAVEF